MSENVNLEKLSLELNRLANVSYELGQIVETYQTLLDERLAKISELVEKVLASYIN